VAEEKPNAAANEAAPSGLKALLGKIPFALIFILLNTISLVAVLGYFAFTKLVYKRERITETSEKIRLQSKKMEDTVATPKGAQVPFGPFTINILATPQSYRGPEGSTKSNISGKLHYVTMSFTLEVREIDQQSLVEQIRTPLLDNLVTLLGNKAFNDIISVQGRYVLAAELLNIANRLIRQLPGEQSGGEQSKEDVVQNVYFTDFIVQ